MTTAVALFGAFALGYVLGRFEVKQPKSDELKDIEASDAL
jgi:hypothetical protein